MPLDPGSILPRRQIRGTSQVGVEYGEQTSDRVSEYRGGRPLISRLPPAEGVDGECQVEVVALGCTVRAEPAIDDGRD